MNTFRYFAFLLFIGTSAMGATSRSVISEGMSFSDAEQLLIKHGAQSITIGMSSPIDDLFPSYKLRNGRIFSIYFKVSANSWKVYSISEVKPMPFKCDSTYYYSEVTELNLDKDDSIVDRYISSIHSLHSPDFAEQGAAANP